jgi:mannan endo-1,4-beta-mannosidase
MKAPKTLAGLALALALAAALPAAVALTADVDAAKVLAEIPDVTYGSNQPLDAPVKVYRHGGNRWTGYNWEINASNAGSDWYHTNDFWLNTLAGLRNAPGYDPGELVLRSLLKDKDAGAQGIVTAPMAGYVAADGLGKVGDDPAPNKRWVKVIPRKGAPFSDPPDLADGRVYVDEFVHHIESKWGKAADGGLRYVCLDNEPALWNSTHPRIHPKPTGYAELLGRSVATASALLDQDPGLEILGPVLYGWQGARRLQDAPDGPDFNRSYGWFAAYYLDKMRQESERQGRRLLTWFDLHWYPEARGGGVRITEAGNNVQREVVQARLQAPRSLWDPDYVESSWITDDLGRQAIRLIPRLQEAVDRWYPGTRLAFTEFSYGGGFHISGGLAVADALGIFGEHGALACHWSTSPSDAYTAAAYRLYLDYDGKGSRYGDRAVAASEDDKAALSVHAALDSRAPGRLTVLVIHKGMDAPADLDLALRGFKAASAEAWRLGAASPAIRPADAPRLEDGRLRAELPPLSATLFVLKQ